MDKKIIFRILIITIVLAVIDVILFSENLVGLSFTNHDTIKMLLSWVVAIINITVLYGEIKFIMTSTEIKYGYDMDKLKNTEDYKGALQSCLSRKTPFVEEVKKAIYQVEAIGRKRMVLDELLEQNNKEYFVALVELGDEARDFIFLNARKILNVITIFDETEYKNNKGNLIEENKSYINKMLESNDKMISEFNSFLTEVSRIGDNESKVNVSNILSDMTNSLRTLRGEEINIKKDE